MSSFINKFLGLVKNIFTGKKKEFNHEPEIIHESESEIESKTEASPQNFTHEHKISEQGAIYEPEAKLNPELQPEIESASTLQPQPESETESSSQDFTQEHEILDQEVIYEPETQTESGSQPQPEAWPESEAEPEPEPEAKSKITHEYDYTQLEQKIRNIITQHYNYSGFMIHDTAGYSRFRTYARNYELELPASDSELRKLIIHSGTLIDGIVYVFSHDDVQRMLCEVQRMLNEGVNVIYFRDLESFIEDSNLCINLSDRRAVCEILRDNYDEYIFTDLYMERPERKNFRSYMEGLKYILAKYFPDGFDSDYALLRKYAERENIILSGNDKALKRETDALRE